MKKSLALQPKDFPQTLRFWLRRPDYGWGGLWNGAPLEVTPDDGRLERLAGTGWYRIRETFGKCSTVVWAEADQLDPEGFLVEEIPNESWWSLEGREIFRDYVRFLLRNSPSVHSLLVMTAASFWLFSSVLQDPGNIIPGLKAANMDSWAKKIGAACLFLPLFSLAVNQMLPSRNFIATRLYRIEAWFLLVGILLSLPGLSTALSEMRNQVLEAAGEAPAQLENPRDPASP